MKILLLHPPTKEELPPAYWSESLGIGYLAAVLRQDGQDVEILDAQLSGLRTQATIDALLQREFDCLGITATHEHLPVLLAIVKAVRKQRKDAIITAGGYLPTLSSEELLRACPGLDFIVRGEGERPAVDVFGRIKRGEDWRAAAGIAYMKDGNLVMNPMPPVVEDLDTLPFPARDALRATDRPVWARIAGSRGCYRACSFCCSKSFYSLSGAKAPRLRSVTNIVDELEFVISTTGKKQFRFIDDDFIGPMKQARERIPQFVEELKKRKLDISFAIECRADEVDEELFLQLKEVGLKEIFIGIESAVQRQLDTYNKRVTVEQNKQAIDTVRKCGIALRSGFIVFDPYVTIPEVLENVQFMQETGIAEESNKIVPVSFVTAVKLYPGVPLIETLGKDGLLKRKGMEYHYTFKYPSTRVLAAILRLSGGIRERLSSLRKPGHAK